MNAPLKKLSELSGVAFDGRRRGYVPPSRHHDITGAIALEPFVGDRRAGDVAAQAFQFLALMGTGHPTRVTVCIECAESFKLRGVACCAHSPHCECEPRSGVDRLSEVAAQSIINEE